MATHAQIAYKSLSLLRRVAPVRQASIKDTGRSRVFFIGRAHFLPRILTGLGTFCPVLSDAAALKCPVLDGATLEISRFRRYSRVKIPSFMWLYNNFLLLKIDNRAL